MQPPSSSQCSPARENRELFGSILASVSRSFYLTIRVLPGPVRLPVGLAYLLARTSDTLADSAGVPSSERLGILREFGQWVAGAGEPSPESLARLGFLQNAIADPSERVLLDHATALLQILQCLEAEDRTEVRRVLEVIVRGQELDLERFSTQGAMEALSSAEELEDYTYRVAGCVGEFWTRICFRHLHHYARKDLEEMIRLGIGFGKGLQLVNILRDAPADLAAGRCYLPAGELERLGIAPGRLLAEPERARPVFCHWLSRAREYLGDGYSYLKAIRPWRLRLACFLPWAIGLKTVALMERRLPLESAERVKVPRREVRRLLGWGLLAAVSNGLLERFLRRTNA